MKLIYKFILVIITSVAFFACSEIADDISTPQEKVNIHPEGFAVAGSAGFHSVYLKVTKWDLAKCQSCHGSNYAGGTTGASCVGCHTGPSGPEACNTCHGIFANPERTAPPTDLDGNIASTSPGVGAHSKHIYDNDLGPAMGCYTCHPAATPTSGSYVAAHIDDGVAEVQFNLFSQPGVSPDSNFSALYGFADNKCSNVYCHGAFEFYKDSAATANKWVYTSAKMSGNFVEPLWTAASGNTEAACGTCHGLPPTGHMPFPLNSCVSCHASVINGSGEIINKLLHINGEINLN
ncbi:MAG: hypothetical protein K9I69_00485 [Ignavibacteriales bacterium]|nr:hypothetical protein [Ignavibacteriales bacterium]MCF8305780.1 hypothetical protein [Ignavibacteriales bacterium]MCF8315502.1 hypothetical protein [Ignavibacteriales bacterium]MCF8436969.1 hypothetical protein [Ignavibacteriales bacterium]